MGSVAISILIGEMHPNEGRISPTHSALLWEGSRSAWVLTDMANPEPSTIWRPYAPERVAPDLLALLAVGVLKEPPASKKFLKHDLTLKEDDSEELDRLAGITREVNGLALSVTIIDESVGFSLEDVKGFGQRDLAVFTPTWSKIWNHWSGKWEERG
ncbi:hypothetical protein IMCC26256_1154 [Actinobacteria bacterium IMCC26256]|nr:hypothetical protein IMCC26256_1154 [Actinobacteria bacterium IMCC26256]